MLEQKSLKTLATKDKVEHFLLLTNFSLKSTKAGKEYLDLELRDQSISINAKMWDGFQAILQSLSPGTVVKILGTMDEFNNQPQLKIERIRTALKEDNVSTSDFLPKSLRPLKEMEQELNNKIDQIKNLNLKKLLKILLSGENFQKYKKVPAGKAWHHAYIGGLLEHTLEIVRICELMSDIHSEINRDLLITGAILHDMGKIEELEYESGFDYTDKGKLLGHIVIAANLIEKTVGQLENFPEDLKNQLIHLVLSHQGKLEFASPVTPKTLEAIVLYHADELSAKTNAYKGAIMAEFQSDNNWTRYLPLAETSLFIPKVLPDSDEFKETLF
ncbi:MAG: HD domain-containing protein [Melioribacteraceae bacterium]|nr:HD domain-containing protein [Melioribacteraceae bacterium]